MPIDNWLNDEPTTEYAARIEQLERKLADAEYELRLQVQEARRAELEARLQREFLHGIGDLFKAQSRLASDLGSWVARCGRAFGRMGVAMLRAEDAGFF